jgi:hypothetical protein
MRRLAALVLPAVFFCAAAHAGLHAEFKDTLDEDIAAFRETVADDPLDDDAYFTLVIAMELKEAFDGNLKNFGELAKKIVKPGETVAHHRLAAALRHRGHDEEATYVDIDADAGEVVVNRTTYPT